MTSPTSLTGPTSPTSPTELTRVQPTAIASAPIAPPLTYAGIGSRRTPPAVQEQMHAIAWGLAASGYILRSGGAMGADRAFERGASAKEIYLMDGWYSARHVVQPYPDGLMERAEQFVWDYHPTPPRGNKFARKLLARNTFQILGLDLQTPSLFVLCWTPDGSLDGRGPDSGGTGQALRVASAYGIPVFNFAREGEIQRLASAFSPAPSLAPPPAPLLTSGNG